MIIRLKEGEIDTETMPLAELSAARDQLEVGCTEIEVQLQDARSRQVTVGVYADPEWYRRATVALGFKRQQLNLLNREIGRRRREENARESSSFARRFMQAARRLLAEETYQMLIDEAREAAGGSD